MYKTLSIVKGEEVWERFSREEKAQYQTIKKYVDEDNLPGLKSYLSSFTSTQIKKLINAQKIDRLSETQTIYESQILLFSMSGRMLKYLVSRGLELQIPRVNYSIVWRFALAEGLYDKLYYLSEKGLDFNKTPLEKYEKVMDSFHFSQYSYEKRTTKETKSMYALQLFWLKKVEKEDIKASSFNFFSSVCGLSIKNRVLSTKEQKAENEALIEMLNLLLQKNISLNEKNVLDKASQPTQFLYPIVALALGRATPDLFHALVASQKDPAQLDLFIKQLKSSPVLTDSYYENYIIKEKIKNEKELLTSLSSTLAPVSRSVANQIFKI